MEGTDAGSTSCNQMLSIDGVLDELNSAQRTAVASPAPVLQVLAPRESCGDDCVCRKYMLTSCVLRSWIWKDKDADRESCLFDSTRWAAAMEYHRGDLHRQGR